MRNTKGQKVKWFSKVLEIDQVPEEGLEYAFVSKNYEQIHQLVWCKDFMQDAIFGYLNSRYVEQYGFEYNPATSLPIYMDKTRLMIANWKDKSFAAKIPAVLDFLNQIERKLKMALTTAVRCRNPSVLYQKASVWILNGSKRWMIAPPMISLYTLFIRIGFVHTKGRSYKTTLKKLLSGELEPYYCAEDDEQLEGCEKAIQHILLHGDRSLFHRDIRKNYPADFDIETLHDSSGIASYAMKATQEQFPFWHRYDPIEPEEEEEECEDD
jgi:hypothetical protein